MSKDCRAYALLFPRVGCILGYAGGQTDEWINYTLLAMNLLAAMHVAKLQSSVQRRELEQGKKFLVYSFVSIIGVILFQIILCLVLGCAGISIVWCALAGWIMSERKDLAGYVRARKFDFVVMAGELLTLALDFIAIVYYMRVADLDTTVAHGLAIVLGAAISRSYHKANPVSDIDGDYVNAQLNDDDRNNASVEHKNSKSSLLMD